MQHPKLRLTIPWDSLELNAQEQITRALALPELICLAVMPDVHTGYDLCIGSVLQSMPPWKDEASPRKEVVEALLASLKDNDELHRELAK